MPYNNLETGPSPYLSCFLVSLMPPFVALLCSFKCHIILTSYAICHSLFAWENYFSINILMLCYLAVLFTCDSIFQLILKYNTTFDDLFSFNVTLHCYFTCSSKIRHINNVEMPPFNAFLQIGAKFLYNFTNGASDNAYSNVVPSFNAFYIKYHLSMYFYVQCHPQQ